MKKYYIIILILNLNFAFAQKLNQYKYAVVPDKFAFQKDAEENNFPDLVKAAMRRYGFDPYSVGEELPADATDSNKVFVDVVESTTMIYTKLNLVLKNNFGAVVFMTQDGKSKEKEYAAAYNEAFRETVKSIELMNHHYSENVEIITDEAIDVLNEKPEKVIVSYISKPSKNGFELLVNDKIEMTLKNTSKKDYYIANRNSISGIVFKIKEDWFFEYYRDQDLVREKIIITF